MFILLSIIIVLILLLVIFWQCNLIYAQFLGAPTVYANEKAIIDAFKLANLRRGQTVVDLGCGDGRSLIIAAKIFNAKGIGVERSLYCYLRSKLNVYFSKQKGIQIVFGDFAKLEGQVKKADIIYLYLLNSVLKNIEDWIFQNIKNDSKIVSLSFQFEKHKPMGTKQTKNLGRDTKIYLYC